MLICQVLPTTCIVSPWLHHKLNEDGRKARAVDPECLLFSSLGILGELINVFLSHFLYYETRLVTHWVS